MADEFELIKAFVSAEVRGARRAAADLNAFRVQADQADRELKDLARTGRSGVDVRGANQAAKAIDTIGDEAKQSTQQVAGLSSKLGGLRSAVGGIAGGIAAAVGVRFLTSQVADSLKLAQNAEVARLQFGLLLRDQEAGAKLIRDIAEFGAETPFQFEDLIPVTRNLLAFGFTAEESIDTLRRLGDVAAGSGADIAVLARVFGRVRLSGRFLTEELNQLTDRSINIIDGLRDIFQTNEEGVRALIEAGKVGFEEIDEVLSRITSAGGLFEGQTVKLSETAAGEISNLRDQIDDAKRDIGTILLPVQFKVVTTIQKDLQGLADALSAISGAGIDAEILQTLTPTAIDAATTEDLGTLRDQLEAAQDRLQDLRPVLRNTQEIRNQLAQVDRLIFRIDATTARRAAREGIVESLPLDASAEAILDQFTPVVDAIKSVSIALGDALDAIPKDLDSTIVDVLGPLRDRGVINRAIGISEEQRVLIDEATFAKDLGATLQDAFQTLGTQTLNVDNTDVVNGLFGIQERLEFLPGPTFIDVTEVGP